MLFDNLLRDPESQASPVNFLRCEERFKDFRQPLWSNTRTGVGNREPYLATTIATRSRETELDSAVLRRQDTDIGIDQTLKAFEKLIADLAKPSYLFRLCVSGTSSRSALAIANVRRLCDQYLAGHYELEVIDVYQHPAETKVAQIIAVPTLIKELPFPPQLFVGDLSNTERIVVSLNLRR